MINPQIATVQISSKYFITLYQNSPESRLWRLFFYFEQIQTRALPRYILYLQASQVCIWRLAEVLCLQITNKIGSTNCKSADVPFASGLRMSCWYIPRHVTEKILNSDAFFPTILLRKLMCTSTLAGLNIRGSSGWLDDVLWFWFSSCVK